GLRSLFVFGWQPILFATLLAALLGSAAFLKPRLAYSLGAVFFLCVALGMTRMAITDTPLPVPFASELHHKVSYEGVVVSDPDVRDANQRIVVRVEDGGAETKMLVVASRTLPISVGDAVSFSGVLLTPQPFDTDGGRTFRYDKYLERDGVRFVMNFAAVRVINSAPWYSVPAALAHVKHAFLNGLAVTLPEPYASLAGGVVIGGKNGLGDDLQQAFVTSGLVQIIVLSGYNVMVVAEWLMALLALTKLSRRWSAGAGAFAILIFIGIAGFSATAIRAALMAFIALFAKATGRTYAASRALLVAVVLMLAWNPLYLLYDPGFGLSVAATAGLIWLSPLFEKMLSFIRSPFWKDALATTLAAQVAVLPLLLYDTGNLSLVALPANLITMPVVPLAMGLSAFAGTSGMLFGTAFQTIGILLAYPAYLANAYLIYVAQKAALLPLAAFTLPPFPAWLVVIAYAALVAIASSKRFSTTVQLRFAKNASI
ncbi:MAG TPA: ComEC/Rec2 family competence protein, partial [Candidatus Paceibacterota bacterium]